MAKSLDFIIAKNTHSMRKHSVFETWKELHLVKGDVKLYAEAFAAVKKAQEEEAAKK